MRRRRIGPPRRRQDGAFVNHAYRAWIRRQPCRVCSGGAYAVGQNEAHHHTGKRGLGQKASDRYMIALCWRCHQAFHEARGPFAGWSQAQRRDWQDEAAEACWAAYSRKTAAPTDGVF